MKPSTDRSLHVGLKIIVPFLIVVFAGGIAVSLVKTAPHPERKVKPRQAPLVKAVVISLDQHPVTIEVWGNVQPAQQTTLRAQIVGEIMEVSPELVPGGRFAKGDTILRLNPADYALAVRQRQTDLAKARADLLMEQGNQVVAKQEFELLGEVLNEREKALVLRLPQLKASKATIEAAKASLASAKLALTRTVLTAPFDATVLQRHVDLGTYITPTTDVVTLVGTNEYWVELSVPISQLRWIKVPDGPEEQGSLVKLYHDNVWGKTTFRSGYVIRLLTDLETEGRMARVLVAIEDPLNLQVKDPAAPPVLVGTYLRAEIQGRNFLQAVKVNRHAIRDLDTVWLLKGDNTLEIRSVKIDYRGSGHVLISDGLDEGERLIVTDIPSATNGMALRLMSANTSQGREEPQRGN